MKNTNKLQQDLSVNIIRLRDWWWSQQPDEFKTRKGKKGKGAPKEFARFIKMDYRTYLNKEAGNAIDFEFLDLLSKKLHIRWWITITPESLEIDFSLPQD